MSRPPSRRINRIPQTVFLAAAAALVVFLFLLGTETINPGDATTMIIAGSLFTVGLIATAFEFELNRTGIEKRDDEA